MPPSSHPGLVRVVRPPTTQSITHSDDSSVHTGPVLDHVIGFDYYRWILKNAWWKIALAVTVVTGTTACLTFALKPIYESTARIAIDLKTPSNLVGETITGAGSADTDQYFNTELQVIQSDTVLRPVAEQFGITDNLRPGKLPQGMRPSDAPVSLPHLSATHPANSFLINISYRSPDSVNAAAVANAVAYSYIVRGREMRAHAALEESAFMEKQIGELKKDVDSSATALAAYEKQLGFINPEEKTSILAARLLQLNAQYTEAQNDRVHKQVDYDAIKSGSLAAIEVSPQALALTHMDENVHVAQQKMESIKTVYGTGNAEYKRAASELTELTRQYAAAAAQISKRSEVEYTEASRREKLLHDTLTEAKNQSDALNADSMQYQELKREAEANKNLYAELYRKVKEAGINGAFQSNAIRIADPARPQLRPVFPNKTAAIGLAFILSLGLSVVVVVIAHMGNQSLRDPEQTQRAIGLDVLGILPYVVESSDLSPVRSLNHWTNEAISKAQKRFGSAMFYEDAVSALLSTILTGNHRRPIRSIMVTSAAQGEGKSSCIAHLASFHAQQGYRTLLIDADLRCPTQHRQFKMEHNLGVSDAIAEHIPLGRLRRQVVGNPMLDIITAGKDSRQVCNHVGRAVGKILEEARAEYDLVFIDACPMLCFGEPIQLAALADSVLVVCLAGRTSRQAVAAVVTSLRRVGDITLGVVLNQVRPQMSQSYGTYQSYYAYMDQMTSNSA